MKKIIPVVVFALFSQGCGNTIAEQVEGIKWKDNHSKIGNVQAYTSFKDGEVRSCTNKTGKWATVAHYEINQNKLILQPGDEQKKKKSFTINFKGQGDEKILMLGIGDKTMDFPLANSADCPL